MALIVVNADDYGLCPSVDEAIDECLAAGVVTSTSVIIHAHSSPRVPKGVSGVHLRLDEGPLLDGRSVLQEWEAQIAKFGEKPTHLDSHHHAHFNHMAVYADLCRRHGAVGLGADEKTMALLRKTDVRAPGIFYRGHIGIEPIPLDKGVIWVMVHPGYDRSDLRAKSSMDSERERQLRYLLSQEFTDWREANNVILIAPQQI